MKESQTVERKIRTGVKESQTGEIGLGEGKSDWERKFGLGEGKSDWERKFGLGGRKVREKIRTGGGKFGLGEEKSDWGEENSDWGRNVRLRRGNLGWGEGMSEWGERVRMGREIQIGRRTFWRKSQMGEKSD